MTLSQFVRIFREMNARADEIKSKFLSRHIEDNWKGKCLGFLLKKSRGHEVLWRFNAGVCLYLCLMGCTDQSGIRLRQHLTLAVHCWAVLCPSLIMLITPIYVTWQFFDFKGTKTKAVCRTGVCFHPSFLCTEYAFCKGDVHICALC